MKIFSIGLSLILLVGCAATEETSPITSMPTEVALGNMSNEAATEALYIALLKANYLVTKLSPTRIAVQLSDSQFVLQPSINSNGIDRILMNRFYAVHPQLQGSVDLGVLIGTLNQQLNFAKFMVRDQGAVIQVQGAATFVNRIELEELRRFMLWTEAGLKQVGRSLPEGAEQLIKPIPVMNSPTAL